VALMGRSGSGKSTFLHQLALLDDPTSGYIEINNVDVSELTEKERSEKIVRGAFNLGDISRGYLAFLTDNVHNENTKIIGEKMDQILVGRILDSNITNSKIEFQEVIQEIDRLSNNHEPNKKWLKTSNNLIGFCVGMKMNFHQLKATNQEKFNNETEKFETAFKAINPSKVNLGKFRRDLSKYFILNYNEISDMDSDELIERFAEITA
jgi:ABC-type oligopeptide transport system ATPase subunit